MPLIRGASDAAKSTNIREMIAAGHPKDQAVAAAYRMARDVRRHRADGGGLMPAKFDSQQIEPHPEYVYHATNHERLHDIADAGKLKTHKPHEFTDQSSWPDGAREKRAYFSHSPSIARNFAPEEGHAALLRTKRTPKIRRESGTSDHYSREPISAKDLEYLHESGAWHPVARQGKAHGGHVTKMHTGPIHSAVAGRTDHLPMHVPEGAYVLPADIVGGFGEGNTIAGFKVAKRLPRLFATTFYGASKPGGGAPYGGSGLPYGSPSPNRAAGGGAPSKTDDGALQPAAGGVPIVAAGGEHVYGPDEVRMIGGGDLGTGHKVLDEFVKSYRASLVKKLQSLPGPKKD